MQQALAEAASLYQQDFQAEAANRKCEPEWLLERRQAAIAAFEAQGLPTRRWEAWRNLDLTPFAAQHYRPAGNPGAAEAFVAEAKAVLPESPRLVFIDGRFSPGDSSLDALPAGVTVRSLRDALAEQPELLQAHLGQIASADGNPFVALNMAFAQDGVLVHVARGKTLAEPLLLAFVASAQLAGRAAYTRVLVVVEEGAELKLVETYHGAPAQGYFSCPVTEIRAGANARVQLYRQQLEGRQAFHIGCVHAELARDSHVTVQSFAAGARTARLDLHADLTAPGAEAVINGLYVTHDGQYCDHHSWMEHKAEHCQSHQLFKGVLDGKSETVYDGLVRVAKGAQKTDARQENRNLLLGKRALAHSNPRLEIFADDVKCSHGSTVGELDESALFYLRSRGIGAADAQGLLTFAFANEVLEQCSIERLREYQRAVLLTLLPGEHGVRRLA